MTFGEIQESFKGISIDLLITEKYMILKIWFRKPLRKRFVYHRTTSHIQGVSKVWQQFNLTNTSEKMPMFIF